MPGIIGRKIGMTSIYNADGQNVACTVIEAGPCVVTQVKILKLMATGQYNWPLASARRRTLPKHCSVISGKPAPLPNEMW